MSMPTTSRQPHWFLHFLTAALVALLIGASNTSTVAFAQAGNSAADNPLIGHWRMTRIVFEKPHDTHLVLREDGVAEIWVVTATERSDKRTGRWSSSGKDLTLKFAESDEDPVPFTFHQEQLVLPNIPNQRGFWDRIE